MIKLLLKLPKFFRGLHGSLWRRLFSKPASMLLRIFFGAKLNGSLILVGWPIFKGEGQIEIGTNGVLVSLPLGNPIGLFRPCIIEAIKPDSVVRIGDNFSASGVCIVSETEVTIGNNVTIGANATIIDTDFHAVNLNDRIKSAAVNSKPILIEDDVWIGMNVVILKGVKIHRGAVLGANTVVTKDIPAGSIAVGNPARIILGSN